VPQAVFPPCFRIGSQDASSGAGTRERARDGCGWYPLLKLTSCCRGRPHQKSASRSPWMSFERQPVLDLLASPRLDDAPKLIAQMEGEIHA